MQRGGKATVAALVLFGALVPVLWAGSDQKRKDPREAAIQPLKTRRMQNDPVTVFGFLELMGYGGAHLDEAAGHVVLAVNGKNGSYLVYLVSRGPLLHIHMPRLLFALPEAPGVGRLHRTLLELNWVNSVGQYAWDPRDGEVRFSYAVMVPDGVGFQVFSQALSACLRLVDEDIVGIREAARPPPEDLPEATPTPSPTKPPPLKAAPPKPPPGLPPASAAPKLPPVPSPPPKAQP